MNNVQPGNFSNTQQPPVFRGPLNAGGINRPLAPNLDRLLELLKKGDITERTRSIVTLEEIARTESRLAPMIGDAFIKIIQDDECPLEILRSCMTSFKTLIPLMTPSQIKAMLSTTMNFLGDEELGTQNTLEIVVALLETDIHFLIPVLLQDLEEIVNPDLTEVIISQTSITMPIYSIRNEMTIRCGDNLLRTVGAIILTIGRHNQNQTSRNTLELIAKSLKNAWNNEKDRQRKLSLGHILLSFEILGNALSNLSKCFPDDELIRFLIEEALDFGDINVDAKISSISEAAVEGLILNPIRESVEQLISSIITGEGSYTIVWMLGEVAHRRSDVIPLKEIPSLMQTLQILCTNRNYQLARHAAEALGKLGSLLDPNQKNQIIRELERILLSQQQNLPWSDAHHMYEVQIAAAWALGEIGFVAGSAVTGNVLNILIKGRTLYDYDVRHAIARALNRISGAINPGQIQPLFAVFVDFLSDRDCKVQKVAARALQGLIENHKNFAITQLQAIVETSGRALQFTQVTSPQEQPKAYTAIIQMLHDISLISLQEQLKPSECWSPR